MRHRSSALLVTVLVLAPTLAFTSTRGSAMWMGTVQGKDGAALSGSVQMSPGTEAGSTVVEVKLKGDAAASVRPWHIHIGSCTQPGGVLGGGKSYTPVTVDATGAGESKATLPIVMPDTGSYYVNIHESAANMAKIAGCGNLMLHKM